MIFLIGNRKYVSVSETLNLLNLRTLSLVYYYLNTGKLNSIDMVDPHVKLVDLDSVHQLKSYLNYKSTKNNIIKK